MFQMNIITLKEAEERGLNRYYTGKPCKWGHYAPRRLRGQCTECEALRDNSDYSKRYERRPDVKRRRENRVFLVKYGITHDEYDSMCKAQDYKCAICHSKDPQGKRLSVDHDHNTGAVRGLLCTDCNLALGKFKDQVSILETALNYLKRNQL